MPSLNRVGGYFAELFDELHYALQLTSIRNALIVGVLVALCAAMLGVILVLKRYALIGHGLGEIGFAALSIAAVLGWSQYSMLLAIPMVCAAAILIMRIDRKSALGGDVWIGIFSTGALALGVILTSFNQGYVQDLSDYMFGSLYGMGSLDVWLSVALSVVVMAAFVLLFNRLFAVSYDEVHARTNGLATDWYQFVLSLLTAVTVVLGMRMMGALLISSFIIFPAITARRMVKSFRGMIIAAAILSVSCFVIGMFLSYAIELFCEYSLQLRIHLRLPTGASVVGVNLIVMCVTYAVTVRRR